MKGGLKAWREAGYEVFTGVNVPSKAFGEVVEHANDTPRIDAVDVQKLLDSKADMVILDSRPLPEFTNMSIPGGIDCPGAELVYRVKDFVTRPETLVVVNCAGRTRSIIGAQSLINAGLPNKVMALKNGTMGWHLAGLKVARGETKSFGPQGPEAAKFAQAAAADIARKMGVKKIDKAGLAKLEAERRAALPSRCARSRRVCAGPPERLPPRRRRPARAGDRPVCRRAQRHHRAARQ